ncbi:hypothetical protein J2W34_005419 [Variovorax boronicumulans]|uniref:hypothetical protein n=1 Tax=Variovorax boronicumulans TaxID=436515 RepID=UPI00278B8BF7|nr:hypothetical protein [Variovorax boronicumulans]MDQ0073610.1 hypothetical protein [Variovorax boronicumulans]
MASSKVEITPTELISTIQRSKLPTVLVEGPDDAVVFRKLEEYHSNIDLSILQCGGRSALLKVFDRRNEVANVQLAFIADQDSWVAHGIPQKYQIPDVIFTLGYSIENDLFLDGDIFGMIDPINRPDFLIEMEKISNWFALMLQRIATGGAPTIDLNVARLLDDPAYVTTVMTLAPGEIYPTQLEQDLVRNYQTLLRGKLLLQLAIRHLTVKHHAVGLMDMIAHMEGPRLKRILNAVANLFSPPPAIPLSNPTSVNFNSNSI